MNTEKKDVFQKITDQIVSAIEQGAGSYRMPWRTSGEFPSSPINAVSKRPYRGINVLILWATAQEKGYKSGTWATYKQWQEQGAQVRKGEKSANVVFWKFFDREQESQAEPEQGHTSRRIPMAKDYWVFNAEQVDGFTPAEEPKTSRAERIEQAEAFFRAAGIEVKPGGTAPITPRSRTAFTCLTSKPSKSLSSITRFSPTKRRIGAEQSTVWTETSLEGSVLNATRWKN